ncbi:MAG: hypothetical protein ACOC3V_00795 [bacterium]
MLDGLVNIVKDDIDNNNKYKNFDKLLNTLSKEEAKYFIEKCGDKVFENDNLSLILWNTHPFIFNDYITSFIDNKVKEIDYSLSELDVKYNIGQIEHEEYKKIKSGYLIHKHQITDLKNKFVSNIIHFLNNNKK